MLRQDVQEMHFGVWFTHSKNPVFVTVVFCVLYK